MSFRIIYLKVIKISLTSNSTLENFLCFIDYLALSAGIQYPFDYENFHHWEFFFGSRNSCPILFLRLRSYWKIRF